MSRSQIAFAGEVLTVCSPSNRLLRLPAQLRRIVAHRALRAGEHARALLISRGDDPVILAALGMHQKALEVLQSRPAHAPADQLARIRALAATGRAHEATVIARQAGRRAPARWRRDAALALAPADAGAALQLLDWRDPDPLFAALLARLGRADDAAAHLERAAPVCANVRLLAATLALTRGDLDAHERAINRVLAAHGLAPVCRADASAPLSVRNVRSDGGQAVEGPLVSVVMAVRDVAPFVDAALGSILGQTWRNLDVIVVDDGSVDDTAARVERWAERDARVRLIRRAASAGPYRARNLGLAQAQGDLVTFHDGDDWSHPARIAVQVAPLLKDARLDATAAHWLRLDARGHVSARQVWPLLRWHPASPTFRRDVVLRTLGAFDEVRTGADCEHWARIRQVFGADRTRILRAPLSFGMARPDSLTHAPETGFAAGSGNPSRLAYWEAWHLWHARAYAAGEVLHLDPAGPRRFPAPPELLVPAHHCAVPQQTRSFDK